MTISEALLNTDGSWAIAWSEVSRTDLVRMVSTAGEVAANSAGRIETRATGTRSPRAYVLKGRLTGTELDLVRQAVADSKHGAQAVRWRHHTDDAAALASACPLFRIADSNVSVARGEGGAIAEVSLTVEEV